MDATETTATATRRRRRMTEEPPVGTQENITGGKYRLGGPGTEESAVESAKWSEEDMEGLAMEEEDETAGGEGGVS